MPLPWHGAQPLQEVLVSLAQHQAQGRRLDLRLLAAHDGVTDQGGPQVGGVAIAAGGTAELPCRFVRRQLQVLVRPEVMALRQLLYAGGRGDSDCLPAGRLRQGQDWSQRERVDRPRHPRNAVVPGVCAGPRLETEPAAAAPGKEPLVMPAWS